MALARGTAGLSGGRAARTSRVVPASTFWLAPWLGAVACLSGCASEPVHGESTGSFEPLVLLSDWAPVARGDDPFITQPDAAPACIGPGFVVEQQWLEIDTALCNWVTLAAPARFSIDAGEQLRIIVSHFDLNAPSAAEGEARLTLGDCDAWSKVVAIPSAAAVYTETFASACSIAEGDVVYFHLHNHGQNNWQLQELSAER